MTTGPKRTQFQRERDYLEIARLYLHGKTQEEIGAEVNLDQGQVCRDLAVIRGRWQKSAVMDMNEAKNRELGRIDELERTYWQAWQDSKQPKETTNTEKSTRGEAATAKASIRKEERDGNPAYLAGVMSCIERRCRLLGIDAPTKTELTGKDGGGIEYSIDGGKIGRDPVARGLIAELLERLGTNEPQPGEPSGDSEPRQVGPG